MLIVWAIGRVPLSWRPPLRKWSAACITKIVQANSSLPPPNKPSNLTPCNEKLPKKADIFTTSYNNTDVHQELLTRLAPLPLTSLGVREVSLAQPEEAEGLGSVEVIEMIVHNDHNDTDCHNPNDDQQKVAVLTMACLVFLGAFIAVLCICCIKMKRYPSSSSARRLMPIPIWGRAVAPVLLTGGGGSWQCTNCPRTNPIIITIIVITNPIIIIAITITTPWWGRLLRPHILNDDRQVKKWLAGLRSTTLLHSPSRFPTTLTMEKSWSVRWNITSWRPR